MSIWPQKNRILLWSSLRTEEFPGLRIYRPAPDARAEADSSLGTEIGQERETGRTGQTVTGTGTRTIPATVEMVETETAIVELVLEATGTGTAKLVLEATETAIVEMALEATETETADRQEAVTAEEAKVDLAEIGQEELPVRDREIPAEEALTHRFRQNQPATVRTKIIIKTTVMIKRM